MRLVLLLAADYANITGDGKLNVMGIFSAINAADFPARHSSMHVIVKLAAELGEYGQTRQLTLKLLDADAKEIMSISGMIAVPMPQIGARPEVNAILELKDLVFPHPGPYQFVVLVDKDYKGDTTIFVNRRDTPALIPGPPA